jgi:copper chaperone CopZ
MKKLIILSLIVFGAFSATKAQKVETNIIVQGICGMCKDRIETALDVKGVKYAEWTNETSVCKVVYNPKKISEMELHKILAEAGHSTNLIEASDEDYNKINACCRYKELEKH